MVIDKTIGFPLRYFDCAGAFVVENEYLCIPEVLQGVNIARGPFFYSDAAIRLVDVADRLNIAIFVTRIARPIFR